MDQEMDTVNDSEPIRMDKVFGLPSPDGGSDVLLILHLQVQYEGRAEGRREGRIEALADLIEHLTKSGTALDYVKRLAVFDNEISDEIEDELRSRGIQG